MIGDTLWLTLSFYATFFAFPFLLCHPPRSDAISSGSVNPHLSLLSGPTDSLLANVSLFLSTRSTITKVTWFWVLSRQSETRHSTPSQTHPDYKNTPRWMQAHFNPFIEVINGGTNASQRLALCLWISVWCAATLACWFMLHGFVKE